MTIKTGTLRRTLSWTFMFGVFTGLIGLFAFDGSPSLFAQTDTTSPTISSVAITSDADADDSAHAHWYDEDVYGIGDNIKVTVTFNENITVTGSPELELDVGGSAKTAEYDSTDESKVIFSYTVASGDSDADGIAVSANKLSLNGGSIRDAARNGADLAHSALSAQSSHKVDGIRPTITRAPYFVDNEFVSEGAGGAYIVGEKLSAKVGFSEEVIAIGTQPLPRLAIDIGGTTRYASFSPIPANDWRDASLNFAYTIVKGDLDLNGAAVAADSLSTNGGSIKDAAGNDAILTHSAVSNNDEFIVDGVPPTVSSIAVTSDPGDDDTYGTDDNIEVTVTLSEDVGYRGTPTVKLDIGGETKSAGLVRETNGVVLFRYAVQNGDNDTDGISIGANSISIRPNSLGAGWFRDTTGGLDVYGNTADLSHDAIDVDSGHKVATAGELPKSTDADLSGLSLSGIVIVSTNDRYHPRIFRPFLTNYTASVIHSISQTTVTPTVNHSGASHVIKLGGVVDADGTISLSTGSNVITVEVTAEDGETTKTYTVTVTRASTVSSDATLKWLELSGIDIGGGLGQGAYGQTRTSFTANVYNSVSQTTVTPTRNHAGASYVIKLEGVTDADGTVSLAVGSNAITVEVTAEDGETFQTYTATVTRATSTAPTTGELSTDDPNVNFRTLSYSHTHVALKYSTPRNRGITGHVVQRYKHDGDSFVSAGDDGRYESTTDIDLGGFSTFWTYSDPKPDTLYKWVVKMLNSQKTTVIESSLTVRPPLSPAPPTYLQTPL